jgi:hypothetical protein
MFLFIQLIILFCSFIRAEYVLYKYDGTELTEQEHRKAYQILLEQQWPTAPAFNSNYNPEIDEETEIAKRLKREVPTVYARWIPKIVYERVLTKKMTDKTYEAMQVYDSQIIESGKDINTLPHFIALHKKANQLLQIALNAVSLDYENSDLIKYYYKIMTAEKMFDTTGKAFTDNVDSLSLKILLLEEQFKTKPNIFLVFRAGPFLPERDFSPSMLQNFANDLSATNVNELRKIRRDHLHNISYGLSFFGALRNCQGASCSHYYYYFGDEDKTYGYALPLKKTDILNDTQFFGIPPLTTLIGSFFCCGELFHARAYTLLTDDLQARQEIESSFKIMYGSRFKPWYDYWTQDSIVSRLVFKVNSPEEVIKQAALRSRYIVQNAIPLNDATKELIDDARSIYK